MPVKVNVITVEGDELGMKQLPIIPAKDDVFCMSGRIVRVGYRRMLDNEPLTVIVDFAD